MEGIEYELHKTKTTLEPLTQLPQRETQMEESLAAEIQKKYA